MQVNNSTSYQAPEGTQRRQQVSATLSSSSSAADAASQKKATEMAAAKSAESPAEQAPRPTTNSQGQTIGSRLNVTA